MAMWRLVACPPFVRTCGGCGCTDEAPCQPGDLTCWWVGLDLCSFCEFRAAELARLVVQPERMASRAEVLARGFAGMARRRDLAGGLAASAARE